MATSHHTIPRLRPWTMPLVTLALILGFAGLAVLDSARDLFWIGLGGLLAAAALVASFPRRATPGAPAAPARVAPPDLWGLSPAELAAVATPALERAGLDMRPMTWREPGQAQYQAWNRGAEGGFVLVTFIQAPEVEVTDLEALAGQVQAHGTASGLVVTAGIFSRGVKAWARKRRIRLKDGAALAALLSGESHTL